MTRRRYVIMANGKGRRWNNYQNIPKYLINVDGETLVARTVRLVRQLDSSAEIFVSSGDSRCDVAGAVRFVPARSALEIDRFAYELIADNVCFLYGDTFYTEDVIARIVAAAVPDMLFFGERDTIFAVLSNSGEKMRNRVDIVRELFQDGSIESCKGWQLYQLYAALPFGPPQIGADYVVVEDETRDFNRAQDYEAFRGCR